MKLFHFNGKAGLSSVLIICRFCVALITVILLISFIKKYSIFSRIHSVSKWLVTFVVLASIFYTLTCLFDDFYWLYADKYVVLSRVGDLLQFLCLHLGQLMAYCYLVHRIYKGFQGTIYSITCKEYILLCVLLICYLMACLAIIAHTIWYIKWCNATNKTDWREFANDTSYFGTIYMIMTLVIDFLVSSYLLVTFLKKLCKISKNLDTLMDAEISNTTNHQNMLIQKNNIYIVISKVAILGSIMLVSSQIVFILCLCNWKIYNGAEGPLTVIYDGFKIFHVLIGSLSLFLGFEFVNNWYMCLCGKCHRIIKKRCLMRMSCEFTFSGQIQ